MVAAFLTLVVIVLPSLSEAQSLVEQYTEAGDDVLILPISSGISGTYQTLSMLFQDNPEVLVFDTKLAVGGIRFLVVEALQYRNGPLFMIKEKLEQLLPRIEIMAIPDTLEYLLAGGRLSKAEWMFGTLLSIKMDNAEQIVLTIEEAQQMLELLEKEPIHHRTAITVLLLTGMRREEVMGLRWRHLDFEEHLISIEKDIQYVPGMGNIEGDTKTRQSRRVVKAAPVAGGRLRYGGRHVHSGVLRGKADGAES